MTMYIRSKTAHLADGYCKEIQDNTKGEEHQEVESVPEENRE